MHDKEGQLYNVSQSKIQLGTWRVVCAVTLYIYLLYIYSELAFVNQRFGWVTTHATDYFRYDRLCRKLLTDNVARGATREISDSEKVLRNVDDDAPLRSAPLLCLSRVFDAVIEVARDDATAIIAYAHSSALQWIPERISAYVNSLTCCAIFVILIGRT